MSVQGTVAVLTYHSVAADGLPAMLFVPPAYVEAASDWLRDADARRPMCNWDALADLSRGDRAVHAGVPARRIR